jgi:protein phosphatase
MNHNTMQQTFFSPGEIAWYGNSHKGRKRANNEDLFYIDSEKKFCLVADGMGGAAAGEVASEFFVMAAKNVFSRAKIQSETDVLNQVKQVYMLANDQILGHAKANPHHKGMGCTAELLAVFGPHVVIGHVGDSRTYRCRDGNLKQMTKDHSLVQQQLEENLITAAEAKTHPLRHVILRAVGIQPGLELDLIRVKALPGDLFLLCSDGLTDMVDTPHIETVLAEPVDLRTTVDRLIDMANGFGGHDNITVVVCRIQ